MAWAKVNTRYADGSELEVEVGTETAGYPDVLAEVTAEVLRLWRETSTDEATP